MPEFEGWLFIYDVNNDEKQQKIRHYFQGHNHVSVCGRAQAADIEIKVEPVPEDDKENCRICRNIRRHARLVEGVYNE